MAQANARPRHVEPLQPVVNLEVEESVLGAMMVSEATIEPVLLDVHLQAEDFYRDRHRTIYGTIIRLNENADPVDVLTVSEALAQRGQLEEVGGRDLVASLAAKVPAPGSAKHYAQIVKQLAGERARIAIGRELTNGLGPAEAIERLHAIERQRAGELGGRRLTLTPASQIEPERIRWAFRHRVPLGSLTLLAGPPKLGKSTWALNLAAQLSRGEADGDLRGEPAASVVVSYEDHPRATLVPRLLAAGADLDHVHILSPTVSDADGLDLLTLTTDLDRIAEMCERVAARLLLVDPLMASLAASTDSHNDKDVRRALAPIGQVAERLDLAALVNTHTTKARDGDLIRRIGASVGLSGAARSLLVMGPDPSDPEGADGPGRVLAHRGNLAGGVPALAYRIEETVIEHRSERIDTIRLVCLGESAARTEELLDPPEREQRTERDDAADLLQAALRDGPRPVRDVLAEAEGAGLSERTIRRAKSELGVEAHRESAGNQGGGRWVWVIPAQDGQPQDGQTLTHTVGSLAGPRMDSGIADSFEPQDGKAAAPPKGDADALPLATTDKEASIERLTGAGLDGEQAA